MTEIERIQRDLDAGYTVTRYGTTKALHKQMLDDIKYLNDLSKDNEDLGDVSCCGGLGSTVQMNENSIELEYQVKKNMDNLVIRQPID